MEPIFRTIDVVVSFHYNRTVASTGPITRMIIFN